MELNDRAMPNIGSEEKLLTLIINFSYIVVYWTIIIIIFFLLRMFVTLTDLSLKKNVLEGCLTARLIFHRLGTQRS